MIRSIHQYNYSWSKLAKLHRAKVRKTPCLSNKPSVCSFSLKVAWSGISLIGDCPPPQPLLPPPNPLPTRPMPLDQSGVGRAQYTAAVN